MGELVEQVARAMDTYAGTRPNGALLSYRDLAVVAIATVRANPLPLVDEHVPEQMVEGGRTR